MRFPGEIKRYIIIHRLTEFRELPHVVTRYSTDMRLCDLVARGPYDPILGGSSDWGWNRSKVLSQQNDNDVVVRRAELEIFDHERTLYLR